MTLCSLKKNVDNCSLSFGSRLRTDAAVEMLISQEHSHIAPLFVYFIYFFNIYSCSILWVLYGDFYLDQRSELRGTENISDELSSEDVVS